jgi:chromosome segregation ATPase
MATSPSHSTPQPSLHNLPEGLSPDSIDTLPVLSAILSRLNTLSPNAASTSGSPSTASPSQLASGTSPLSVKDIPAATDDLKHKLQKARAQVKELPDIDRSLAEQEEEIRELEEKIRKQREVLERLRKTGLEAKKEIETRDNGQLMEGIES